MGIKSHYLEDSNGKKFYPYAHANATFDSNGVKVGTRLDEIANNINNINSNINEHLEDTDKHITPKEREKLSNISEGADVNVQSDWNETDTTSDTFIKNKPTSLPANGGNADTVNGYIVESNVPSGAKFTDTIYDDTVLSNRISKIEKDYLNSEDKEELENSIEDAKTYTDTKVSGLASTTVVDNKVSAHNTSTSAHSDIRTLISDLTTKVNNFLDVDDTTKDQLSEVITLIENNKGTLESLTTSKVNVSDIIDNLTTANTSKVLSANQGVIIKGLIDTLQTEVSKKLEASDTITNATNASSSIYAISAGSASKATSATSATYASTANYGKTSGTATYSTNSGTSTYSSNSSKATSATSAVYSTTSTKAGTATYSSNSAKATSATSATYSSTATYATNSETANTASGVANDADFDFGDITNND